MADLSEGKHSLEHKVASLGGQLAAEKTEHKTAQVTNEIFFLMFNIVIFFFQRISVRSFDFLFPCDVWARINCVMCCRISPCKLCCVLGFS